MNGSAGAGHRVGTRFRFRVMANLLILGFAAVVATAAGTTYLMWRVLDERLADDVQALGERQRRLVREAGKETERALLAMQYDLTRRPGRFLELAADPDTRADPRVTGAAADYVRLTGVDTVEIVDRDGIVLSSAHWPEGAGVPHLDLLAWSTPRASDRPLLVDLATADGERAALAAVATVGTGASEVVLMAGLFLEGRLLDRVYPGSPAAVIDSDGRVIAHNGRWPDDIASPHLRPLQSTASGGETGRAFIRHGAGSVSMADGDWLDGPGQPATARLLVLIDVTEHRALKRRLAWLFAGVGVVVLLLAINAGIWISRAVTRPLEEMARAVDAVSRGEADYSFSLPGRDGLGGYVESFSRMTRALEYERGRLRAVERVAAWREAARRVAHEVKNPLVPIRLSVENLVKARESVPERFDEMFDEATAAILEEVERLRRIVTEFSEYAKLPEPRPRVGDLNDLVDSVVSLYGSDDRARLQRVREGTIPRFAFDPDLIAQALKNVLANAVEAVQGDGGVVIVRTSVEDDLAVVTVSDDGPGIPEPDREHVFDPYFTTKSGGTGLGLAITSRIVTEHGGLLIAEERTEGGTRVVIRLPLDDGQGSIDRVSGAGEERA